MLEQITTTSLQYEDSENTTKLAAKRIDCAKKMEAELASEKITEKDE